MKGNALKRAAVAPLAAIIALAFSSGGCGYHVAGKADLLPKSVQSIAVPAFGNNTIRYHLADQIGMQITRELISRTRYDVVSDVNRADAILEGTLLNAMGYPTVFDQATGRASGVMIIAIIQVTLRERETGKVLFTRPAMEFRERYEISTDPKAYFEENSVAMNRLARDVARSIVSAVLENF